MSITLQTQVKAISALQPSFTPVQTGFLQRKCACGQHTVAGGECAECRQKREGIMQRAAVNSVPVNGVPPIVHDVLSSSGQPLDAGTRAFMEPRFGYDFSQVRVHTDARVAESARAVNALAYTVGRDVVFGEGQYAPEASDGRGLLAHELTHVVQQGNSTSVPFRISTSSTSHEREATQAASDILTGQSIPVNGRMNASLLQRQEDRRHLSLFPLGQRPLLHLDISALRPIFNLQGVSNLRPISPPRVPIVPIGPSPLGSPRSSSIFPPPHIPAADEPNKIVDLNFDTHIEEMSLAAYTLARLGYPLQTSAEQKQERFEQLMAVFSGQEVEDTPLGLRLLSTGVDLLGVTNIGHSALERTHLDNVTFIINPATRTFGINVQINIPPSWLF